jgi:hypothetical protein
MEKKITILALMRLHQMGNSERIEQRLILLMNDFIYIMKMTVDRNIL